MGHRAPMPSPSPPPSQHINVLTDLETPKPHWGFVSIEVSLWRCDLLNRWLLVIDLGQQPLSHPRGPWWPGSPNPLLMWSAPALEVPGPPPPVILGAYASPLEPEAPAVG